MIPYVRQEKIIEILANKELIKIEELQKELYQLKKIK